MVGFCENSLTFSWGRQSIDNCLATIRPRGSKNGLRSKLWDGSHCIDSAYSRTYFCIYLFSGMITLVFASPPVVTAVDARGLFLPCSSKEWNSKTHTTSVPSSQLLYDSEMMALWSGNPLHCNAFGIRILTTSIFLEIWQAQHGYGSWLPGNWRERNYIVLVYLQNHISFALHVIIHRNWAYSRLPLKTAIH
jgi:hypothetical protein